MNSISAWFAVPLSLAVLGTVFIIMRCLRRKHVNVTISGLGVEIKINTFEKDVGSENYSEIVHDGNDGESASQGTSARCTRHGNVASYVSRYARLLLGWATISVAGRVDSVYEQRCNRVQPTTIIPFISIRDGVFAWNG